MLQDTRGIVLRSVKYGETSLIVTLFTEHSGVQAYLLKGIRNNKKSTKHASLFQSATLLDLIVYQQPSKNLQRLREYNFAYIYNTVQQSVIKNTIALFSVELLLRILPEHAIMQPLFDFSFNYFVLLDNVDTTLCANMPLYFIVCTGTILGYELKGTYSIQTPYLDISEGGYTDHIPNRLTNVTETEANALSKLIAAKNYEDAAIIEMNGSTRIKLIEWYLGFLQQHAQHVGSIRSLEVIRSILH